MHKDIKISVSSDFYGGGKGIDDILNDYYEREIRKIGNPEEQSLVRKFIEEGLIIDGNRVSVSEAGIISQFNIPQALLNRLRESRLIRAETTHLGKAYEVSHDTLVSPILKSFEKRRISEERIENARKIKEEHEALRKETQKKRRARLLAALGFLLFFIALIALYFAIQLRHEARTQTKIAQSSALTAHSIFETQKNENVTLGFGLAKAALDIDDNTDARKGLFSVYYKGVGTPSNYFYTDNLNCNQTMLLSAYYSPKGNYIIVNSWDKKACLFDKEGNHLRTIQIENGWPRKKSFFSSDDKYLLTISLKQTVEVWDLASLTESVKPIATLKGHTEDIIGLAFSDDGQSILTYGNDGKVFLWNSNWELIKTIGETKGVVNYAGFSPDGKHILTIEANGNLQIRDREGTILKNIYGEHEKLYSVDLSPDSLYFAMASDENVLIRDWNGKLITELKGHQSYVNDIAWSPDGKYIATSSSDKTVKIWNIKGEIVTNIHAHNATINAVDFSPDGTTILTASKDNTSKVWTLDGELLATLSGHFESVTSAEYAPDGKKILSFSEFDFTAKEWEIKKSPITNLLVGSEEVIKGKFSPKGNTIATCGSKTAMLWTFNEEDKTVQEIGHISKGRERIHYVSFSPTNDLVAAASEKGTARIWNIKGDLISSMLGHEDQILRLDWSPNGQELVTASYDKTAKVWDRSGKLLHTLEGHKSALLYAGFSPNGKHIGTASADGTLKIWDRQGGLLKTLIGHADYKRIVDAEFSPKGDYIVSASEDNTARIWDLSEGEDFGKSIALEGHLSDLVTVDFSPDGQYIVSASVDKTAIIWNRKGEKLVSLVGHERPLSKAKFSNDGTMIATSSSDNTAKVWTLDGMLISEMIGHKNSVNDVNFSPDDQFVLTAGSDHQAKVWPILSIEEIIGEFENTTVTNLNEETKNRYKIRN